MVSETEMLVSGLRVISEVKSEISSELVWARARGGWRSEVRTNRREMNRIMAG